MIYIFFCITFLLRHVILFLIKPRQIRPGKLGFWCDIVCQFGGGGGGYIRQACSPLIQLFFGFASDIDQTNINRDIRDVYTRPFFTLKNHFENWTFHCTLHFWHCKKKTTLSVGPVLVQGWGRLQKNWAAQFLLSHQLTQAFSGESETAPMILNSFQTFLYYAYSSRKTQCSGRLLEHRGRKIYNFPTFYVISNDVFRLLATFWTSQSTHGTDS